MYWNKILQENITTFLTKISQNREVSFPFLIIESPQEVQVLDWIVEQGKWVVDPYIQDLQVLRDLSYMKKKKHIIKVKVNEDDHIVETEKRWPVIDRWSRDIIDRFTKAPFGDFKIIIIEHIERMNITATNAMLKLLEEPLPWRLIIATSQSVESLLDTIRSRAMVMRAVMPSLEELSRSLDTSKYNGAISHDKIIAWLSLTLGDVEKTYTMLGDIDESWLPIFLRIWEIIRLEWSRQQLAAQAKLLVAMDGYKSLQVLESLQLLAGYYQRYDLIDRCKKSHMYISGNVGEDNVWWGL